MKAPVIGFTTLVFSLTDPTVAFAPLRSSTKRIPGSRDQIFVGLRNNRWTPNQRPLLTTTESSENEKGSLNRKGIGAVASRAVAKFKARPVNYLLIPCIAALVGWITNYLAVQMIFYPIGYWGLPIYRVPEVPLGFLGWQGIVPCKTRAMSETMVHMVTTQLLSLEEVFGRLDPRRVAELLAPEIPKLGQEVIDDILTASTQRRRGLLQFLRRIPQAILLGLPQSSLSILHHFNKRFLADFTVGVQQNIESVFSVRDCVVDQMMKDRSLLGQLFQKCGQKELDFLTNSGLWFGFLLGLLQLLVALVCDNPWTLSIGGGIVGLATNWLALKWIFEPVNPTKIGPFIFQGKFLRRQPEVAKEFSKFFANNVLTSKKVWQSILVDNPSPAFASLFSLHVLKFLKKVTGGLALTPEPEVLQLATKKALAKLPDHVHVLHDYVDKTLKLEDTLRVKMEQMSSAQFERVLHPIFEEDELTLILAGAALGFAAGLVQQGLETGHINLPDFRRMSVSTSETVRRLAKRLSKVLKATKNRISSTFQRKESD